MADHHRASLVVDALTTAAGRGPLQAGCIAHSDRGSEYTPSQRKHRVSEITGKRRSPRSPSRPSRAPRPLLPAPGMK
ncbi:hypothetical protein ACFUJR_29130 [Streptomyces sp. NPDC057271]|uniref:hypothetical protein n=1 Tax=unclassified Streptomyces TaxID=2593676 RepID=UPI003642AA3A